MPASESEPTNPAYEYLKEVVSKTPEYRGDRLIEALMRLDDKRLAKEEFIRQQPEPLKTFYSIEQRQAQALETMTVRNRVEAYGQLFNDPIKSALVVARRENHRSGYQLVAPTNFTPSEKQKYGIKKEEALVLQLGENSEADLELPLVIKEDKLLVRYFRNLLTVQDRLFLVRFR